MSWGTELWDRYDAMCTYTSNGIDFLDTSLARFISERGKIENEYASKLRKLVNRFTPKDAANANSADEYSHMNAYRQMLTEVGYIAGQHEVLADSFQKENYRKVRDNTKKFKEIRRLNMEKRQKNSKELKQLYSAMEKSKDKLKKFSPSFPINQRQTKTSLSFK